LELLRPILFAFITSRGASVAANNAFLSDIVDGLVKMLKPVMLNIILAKD